MSCQRVSDGPRMRACHDSIDSAEIAPTAILFRWCLRLSGSPKTRPLVPGRISYKEIGLGDFTEIVSIIILLCIKL